MKDVVQTPAQMAIRFCLSFDAVSTVIPGMLNAAEVEENTGASSLPVFSASELDEFKRLYESRAFFLGKESAAAAAAIP